MERLSKSKIISLINCPLSYWFKYLSGMDKTDESDDMYQVAGTEVHDRLDKLYDQIEDNIYDMPLMDQIFLLDQAYGKAETDNPGSNEIIEKGRDNFIDWQLRMNKKIGAFYRPHDKEQHVEFRINQKFIDKFVAGKKGSNADKIRAAKRLSQPYMMNGYIDRVDCINGEYSVMDYKSKTTSVKAWELALYAIMASIDLEYPISHVSCWGYKDDSYFYRKLTVNNINFALLKILEYDKNLARYKRLGFKKIENKWSCGWCEYKELCKTLKKSETIMED